MSGPPGFSSTSRPACSYIPAAFAWKKPQCSPSGSQFKLNLIFSAPDAMLAVAAAATIIAAPAIRTLDVVAENPCRGMSLSFVREQ
jgi:hypothetical protein